jgi:multiple antibiotic resistance protein
MALKPFIVTVLYLAALINPLSKVFFLASSFGSEKRSSVVRLSLQSTLVAFLILVSFALAGNFILRQVFHAELYSFRIVGGVVLLYSGFRALLKGAFFETPAKHKLTEYSIVPLASPLIAGPATITAVISFTAESGYVFTMTATAVALGVNLVFMLFAFVLFRGLKHFNLTAAFIRVTGLVVSVMSMQMILSGLAAWILTWKGV